MLPSRFLIGVDSDGTAFDSMNKKHIDAFIPAALETWPMEERVARRFMKLEKRVNLFSATRGVNRFPGLLMALEGLGADCPTGLADLRAYVNGETKYSPSTLKKWMAKHPSMELEKVLRWSERADELFAAACEGLQPFPGVREALAAVAGHAAVAVVSSAAKAGLEHDWAAGGLTPFVDFLMSQEDGSKTAQLQKAQAQCGEGVSTLMLGDTDSDGAAAHEAGALFYPIMPGDEERSWKRFREDVLPLFLAGKYDEKEEAKYFDQLKAMLHSNACENGC